MNQPVAAVHIVTPLIEALRCYKEGRASKPGESGTFFKNEAKEIFPLLESNENMLTLLYKGVRCGFAHQGFVKDDSNRYNILISLEEKSDPITSKEFFKESGEKYLVMTIYSRQYVKAINSAYQGYFEQLDRDTNELDKFYCLWKFQWDMKKRHPAFSGTSTES